MVEPRNGAPCGCRWGIVSTVTGWYYLTACPSLVPTKRKHHWGMGDKKGFCHRQNRTEVAACRS